MRIKLLTEYVDNEFCKLKENFHVDEEIQNSFLSNSFLHYLLLYEKGDIIGYLCFNVLYDKVEIIYIHIKDQFRNKGYGSKLIENLINFCKKNKIINITLEVNKLNKSAIALYKKYDFLEVAIRKAYYNGIDGILMERKMM